MKENFDNNLQRSPDVEENGGENVKTYYNEGTANEDLAQFSDRMVKNIKIRLKDIVHESIEAKAYYKEAGKSSGNSEQWFHSTRMQYLGELANLKKLESVFPSIAETLYKNIEKTKEVITTLLQDPVFSSESFHGGRLKTDSGSISFQTDHAPLELGIHTKTDDYNDKEEDQKFKSHHVKTQLYGWVTDKDNLYFGVERMDIEEITDQIEGHVQNTIGTENLSLNNLNRLLSFKVRIDQKMKENLSSRLDKITRAYEGDQGENDASLFYSEQLEKLS